MATTSANDSSSKIVRSPFPDIDIPTVDVFTFIKNRYLRHPEDILFTSGSTGETFSAKRIVDSAERVASALAKRGVGKSDGVSVIAANSVEYLVTCLATLALGAVFAPVYTSLDVPELRRQAEAVGSKVIACSSNYLKTARQARRESSLIEILIIFDADKDIEDAISFKTLATDDSSAFSQPPEIDVDEDPAIVQSSSGTTGLPKGIVLTHRNIVANQMQQLNEELMGLKPGERTMVQAPMAHVGGLELGAILFSLQRANCVVVADFEVSRDLSLIRKYEMKFVYLTAWHMAAIAKGRITPTPDLTSLRGIISAGSTLSVGVEDMFRQKTGVTGICQGYGLTEVGGITESPLKPENRFPGSVGFPIPNVEMKIVDPSTGQDLHPTRDGEVCCRSPSVMKEYLNAPAATASVIDKDGWFHTGDIGHFNAEGHLFITDRIKELISYKDGQHVAPAFIESVLLTHPAVAECVVTGVNIGDNIEPRAFVVLQPDTANVQETDLQEFVAERTSVLNRLRGGIKFLDKIPKSPSSKPLKKELRKL